MFKMNGIQNNKIIFLIYCICLVGGCQTIPTPRKAMMDAVNKGDIKTAESILTANSEIINMKENNRSEYGGTPLHEAAAMGYKEVTQFLIAKGADVNSKNVYGRTPLAVTITAFCMDQYKVPSEFPSKSPSIRMTKTDMLRLNVGFRMSGDIAKLLIDSGADVNCKDNGGFTPLHLAAIEGRLDMVRLLIASGADINAKDYWGNTALHHTASASQHFFDRFYDNLGVAKFIIVNGADINARDKNGFTPLHKAALYGIRGIAEVLITNGADVNASDNNGFTPLHAVARSDFRTFSTRSDRKTWEQSHKYIAELLIAKGADINARDKNGFTPLHRATEIKWKLIADLIREHGGVE